MSHVSIAQQQFASTLNFIDGQFVAAASGKTFENRSPVDGRLLGLVSEAGEAEVDAAVKAARAALAGPWGALEMAERTELLYAVANEINRRFDEFLEAEVADTGKPASLARHIDIPRGAANFKIFADVVKNVPSEFFQMATPDKKGAINYAIEASEPKEVLRYLIEMRGLKQGDLAEIVPQSNLSAILAGKRKISATLAGKLAKFFNVSPAVFVPV